MPFGPFGFCAFGCPAAGVWLPPGGLPVVLPGYDGAGESGTLAFLWDGSGNPTIKWFKTATVP